MKYNFDFIKFVCTVSVLRAGWQRASKEGIDQLAHLLDHLLVVAAMEEEESAIVAELGALHSPREVTISQPLLLKARQWNLGEKRNEGGRQVGVVRSGMGNVNAAITVALYADRYPVSAILLLGVGGALVEDLVIGQLVVSTEVLQHDYFSSLDCGDLRMTPGTIVFTPEEATKASQGLAADPQLLSWLSALPARVGAVLSGNEFVGTQVRKRAIAALHSQALLVDMEGAGVAQVAKRLGIPFVIAKTVADRLCPDGSIESDFKRCLISASRNAALALSEILRFSDRP